MSGLTTTEVYALLNAAVARVGGQAEFARRHGVSRQHVNQTLNAVRPPGGKILAALGLREVTRYAHTNGGPQGGR